jgi:hypothetical protein
MIKIPKKPTKTSRFVVADDNLRSFSPLWKLMTLGLMLDRLNVPAWAMGAFAMLACIMYGVYFYRRADEISKSIEGFGEDK